MYFTLYSSNIVLKAKKSPENPCIPKSSRGSIAHETKYYSHSIVAGGFDVISYTIRLMCCTSFTIRREIVSNTS